MNNIFKNNTFLIIVVVILIIILICCIFSNNNVKNEGFDNNATDDGKRIIDSIVNGQIYKQSLVNGNPPATVSQTDIITSGTDYLEQIDVIPAWGDQFSSAETLLENELSDGEGGSYTLATNLCSPSCCSQQYPVPFKLESNENICANRDNFVPSNIVCNNTWNNSGCMCITKKQMNYLRDRGGNA